MGQRQVNFKPEANITPCPKCGNTSTFTARSQQFSEDCCEIWLVCSCGHDPHQWNQKLEDVWGELSPGNIMAAKDCWNEAIASLLNCPHCAGDGKVLHKIPHRAGKTLGPCRYCNGTGKRLS